MAPEVERKQRRQQEMGQHCQHHVAPDSGAVNRIHPAGQSSGRAHFLDGAGQGGLAVESPGLQFGGLVFDMGL